MIPSFDSHIVVRVLLLTSTPTLARGFGAFESEQADIYTATCTDDNLLCAVAEKWNATVVLLDTADEGRVDFTSIKALRQRCPECRVVLWIPSLSVEVAHQARAAGVDGVLYKDASDDLLLRCLTAVSRGETWFPRKLLNDLLDAREVRLSPRERQLTDLVARGLSNKLIAAELMISEGTVKVYLHKLFQKLGVHDRYELALHGLKNRGVTAVTTTTGATVARSLIISGRRSHLDITQTSSAHRVSVPTGHCVNAGSVPYGSVVR